MNVTDRLDELLARWQDQCEQGRKPTPAEVCDDCPELAGEFEQRLQRMQHLAAWLGVETAAQDETPYSLETVLSTGESADVSPLVDLPFLDTTDTPGCLGRLGPYRVLEVLGEGGMGVVLKAEEQQPRRLVAIKVMRPEKTTPETRARFLREGQALALVQHDRVVPVFRVDEFRGVPFLVMPLLAGESLQARLKRDPYLPLSEVLRIGREAAEGLAAAHAAGLIHRDIKPSNIWLREMSPFAPRKDGSPPGAEEAPFRGAKSDFGGEPHVVLLDFGLARLGESAEGDAVDLTRAGSVLGTAAYMAPEQAAGRPVDARADLFSLGCVLYELATGQRAFTGPDTLAVLSALANSNPPSPSEARSDVPQALSALIMQLLSKQPAGRPKAADEVVSRLRRIEQGASMETATQDWSTPSSTKVRRGVRFWASVGTAVGAAGLVLWAGLAAFNHEAVQQGTSSSIPPVTSMPTATAEPLRVLSIDVQHFEKRSATEAVPRGVLGQQSFYPRLGDQVTIEATLSRPSYAYLVAFRPDGVVELCAPEDESQRPTKSDQVRYPAASDSGIVRYGLAEGTGLWMFAVVASDEPLPAYREWVASSPPVWSPQPATAGTVWWYDGEWMNPLTGAVRGTRGKGEQALGTEAFIVQVAQRLQREEEGVTTAAIGFGVGPAK
jgi:serine/threonine protein kinase